MSARATPPLNQTSISRQLRRKYFLLTLGFLLPLTWAVVRTRNLYPVASWNVMTQGGQLQQSCTYFVLRGETVSGEVIDIPAISVSNAMRSRNWGMVAAIARNESLKLPSPHPKNAELLTKAGATPLPEGVRMNDLLKAWGESYNSRHAASSPTHLKAIRLDAYQWPGHEYSNFRLFVQSWRQEL